MEAEVGLEQVRDAAGAGDGPERAQHREGVRRLRHVSPGHEGPQEVARERVVDLGGQPLLERDRVELRRARVHPRRLRVELGDESVELRDGARVGTGRSRRERVVVTVVAVERPVGVDVEVVALAVGVEELDPELGEQGVHLALVGRDPLAAELVRLAADLDVEQASADAVARLEHDDLTACRDELRGGDETGEACAHHDDVCILRPDHPVRVSSHIARSAVSTCQPSRRNRSAVAAPMPRLAPVTRATRDASSGHTAEHLGDFGGTREEGRVPAVELDRLDAEQLARHPP